MKENEKILLACTVLDPLSLPINNITPLAATVELLKKTTEKNAGLYTITIILHHSGFDGHKQQHQKYSLIPISEKSSVEW